MFVVNLKSVKDGHLLVRIIGKLSRRYLHSGRNKTSLMSESKEKYGRQ